MFHVEQIPPAVLEYEQLLLKQNKTINLISRKIQENIREEITLPCLKLATNKIFNEKKLCYDLGSGGGIPGIIIGIMNPELEIVLIDSTSKKCYCMKTFIKKLNLKNITVQNDRIENIETTIKPDIFTASFLGSIEKINSYTKTLQKHQCHFLLIKGENEELPNKYKSLTLIDRYELNETKVCAHYERNMNE
jgi:16S rRNA (guanine527-N7)-methyltransferase